jgi:hypothetical protein
MSDKTNTPESELAELKADLQELLREAREARDSTDEDRRAQFCFFVIGYVGSMLEENEVPQSANATQSQPAANGREEHEHKNYDIAHDGFR